jgi:SAM-dependent methyltransferase
MSMKRVPYDRIAVTYDERYMRPRNPAVTLALLELARQYPGGRLLEVGCGTGHWLAEVGSAGAWTAGLDLSSGMLRQARERLAEARLVCGRGEQLPFRGAFFDLIFCVNALHHFERQDEFVFGAKRALRSGGTLAVIGMDPHKAGTRWYLYDYFPGTKEMDLQRYPSEERIATWMAAAGFRAVETQVVERVAQRLVGREVLGDYFLGKNSASQLILLSDQEYEAGMARIRAALKDGEASGETREFPVELTIVMVKGRC